MDQEGCSDNVSVQTFSDPLKRSITFGYYLLFASIGISSSMIGPALLGLAQQTHSTLQQLGLIFLLGPIAYMIGSWAGGHFFDRIPGHRLLIMAVIFMAASRFFMPLSSTLLLLTVLTIISGITVGVAEVGGNTLLVWLHGDKVGAYINGLHFWYGLGAVLGPVFVAGTIKLGMDIPKVFWVAALISILIAVYLLFFPSPSFRPIDSPLPTQASKSTNLLKFGLLLLIATGIEASLSGWLFTYVVKRNMVA